MLDLGPSENFPFAGCGILARCLAPTGGHEVGAERIHSTQRRRETETQHTQYLLLTTTAARAPFGLGYLVLLLFFSPSVPNDA